MDRQRQIVKINDAVTKKFQQVQFQLHLQRLTNSKLCTLAMLKQKVGFSSTQKMQKLTYRNKITGVRRFQGLSLHLCNDELAMYRCENITQTNTNA